MMGSVLSAGRSLLASRQRRSGGAGGGNAVGCNLISLLGKFCCSLNSLAIIQVFAIFSRQRCISFPTRLGRRVGAHFGAILAYLGPILAHLRPQLGDILAHVGPVLGILGQSCLMLVPSWVSWSQIGRSWAILGLSLGHLGSVGAIWRPCFNICGQIKTA
jgi:hypothetical protein